MLHVTLCNPLINGNSCMPSVWWSIVGCSAGKAAKRGCQCLGRHPVTLILWCRAGALNSARWSCASWCLTTPPSACSPVALLGWSFPEAGVRFPQAPPACPPPPPRPPPPSLLPLCRLLHTGLLVVGLWCQANFGPADDWTRQNIQVAGDWLIALGKLRVVVGLLAVLGKLWDRPSLEVLIIQIVRISHSADGV